MTKTDLTRRTVVCRLLLRNEHWVPIGINAELSAAHQSAPGGPVIVATLVGFVEGDHFLGWPEANNVHAVAAGKVQPDGSVVFPSDDRWVMAMGAEERDQKAKELGAIGINQRLSERALNAPTQVVPDYIRDAAFARATIQVTDKLHGKRVEGVFLGPAR